MTRKAIESIKRDIKLMEIKNAKPLVVVYSDDEQDYGSEQPSSIDYKSQTNTYNDSQSNFSQ
jgi:hypothetical protein